MRHLLAAVAASMTLLAAACGDDGTTLRPPQPGATAPLRTTTTSAATVLTLTSPDVAPGGEIPAALTCDGEGRPPIVSWAGVPEGTAELAVALVDLDEQRRPHWVVTGIDPATSSLSPDVLPEGAVAAPLEGAEGGWVPPCPPGGATHSYELTLYALAEPPALTPGRPAPEVLEALDATPGWRDVLVASLTRD